MLRRRVHLFVTTRKVSVEFLLVLTNKKKSQLTEGDQCEYNKMIGSHVVSNIARCGEV